MAQRKETTKAELGEKWRGVYSDQQRINIAHINGDNLIGSRGTNEKARSCSRSSVRLNVSDARVGCKDASLVAWSSQIS